VKIPRYPVTVSREDSVKDGHWATGKADGRTALKPGDFGIRAALYGVGYFFLSFEEKA